MLDGYVVWYLDIILCGIGKFFVDKIISDCIIDVIMCCVGGYLIVEVDSYLG